MLKKKSTVLEGQVRTLAALSGVIVMVAAEAFAQDNLAQPDAVQYSRRIVISIPDHKLALVDSGRVVKIYSTAVGAKSTPSPTGSYKVVQRIVHPTWYGKGKIVPPGKSCPIGTRWIGLSAKGYGIHGTNEPASIGHNASHGCIRMLNRDVEELFELVAIGDAVELYNQRTPDLDRIFGAPAAPASPVQTSSAAGQ
jgi:lipoprotein-anchoring transpeptidase ErfK/SrfK